MTRSKQIKWQRSSYCDSNACPEVAITADEVLLRDSKDPDGEPLSFSPEVWAAFMKWLGR
jgi:hypothetical protein